MKTLIVITGLLFIPYPPAVADRTDGDWNDKPDYIASPDAEVGGKVSIYVAQYPKSFNYLLDNNSFSSSLFGLMYIPLLTVDPLSGELVPSLARSWEVGEDKKTFTFHLYPQARWSDGKPITAHDVKWTFDTIMDPKNLTGIHKVSLERFETPEVIDDRTIRFKAKEVHWKNLVGIGLQSVLPRHAFEGKDFNKINFEFPVVAGPYRIAGINEGFSLTLERLDDWWQSASPFNKGKYNYQTILFRFYNTRENAFEAFKKGEIDIFAVYTSYRWVQQTSGEKFNKNWIIKQKIYNNQPRGFQGFAMNMRREPYSDKRVRLALAHLLNRRKMNETLMHNQYFMLRSYWSDVYDKQHPCNNPLFEFDKGKARSLLAEAGWEANPDTGFLEKDGKPFVITFLTRAPSSKKFLVIYKEDLEDVGIQLKIDQKDWAAWAKDMEEFNFEMTWAAWGAALWKDPEGMWHSKEAERIQGNNITGFSDPRVDELTEKQKTIFNREERLKIIREIDGILTEEVPYILLWANDYVRLLYWNKFGTPDTVLSKFGSEEGSYGYWWIDPDSEADLEDAVQNGDSLPGRPFEVRFEDQFKGP